MTARTALPFPGGTSISRLRVYDDAAPDGVCGGSPHLHTVSTESYVVTGGAGGVQTLDRTGFAEHSLEPGAVVWFGAGTIHRAINGSQLEVTVVMSNQGLPEAGDAVLTFPADVMADPERYREAVTLPDAAHGRDAASRAARARRDLAVLGFGALRDSVKAGDTDALEQFYAHAVAIAATRASEWPALREQSVLADAARGTAALEAVLAGRTDALGHDAPRAITADSAESRFGMCGTLRAYDVR